MTKMPQFVSLLPFRIEVVSCSLSLAILCLAFFLVFLYQYQCWILNLFDPFMSTAMETRFRSGFCAFIILLCVSFSGIVSVCGESRRPKNVQVAVRAKWEGTPVLLEAGYARFFYKNFM